MNFIFFLSNAFIKTMGITQPSPETARRAAWFIFLLLTLVVIAIITIALVATHVAARH